MGNNIVNNFSSNIITIYQSVIKNYEMNLDTIKQCEDELQDLMHEIELSEPKNAAQGYKLYREIRELRIKRRTAKEQVELLRDLHEYFTSPPGQAFKSKIQSIQGNSVKLRAAQEARTYTPRRREDLTIVDKHSTESRSFEDMLSDFKKTKVTIKNGKLRK